MGDGESAHERSQQLALPGSGRADQEPVWTHTVQGRLAKVQGDRTHLGIDADRNPEERLGVGALPCLGDALQPAIKMEAQQFEQTGALERSRCVGGR
jgi:hypothetical protein